MVYISFKIESLIQLKRFNNELAPLFNFYKIKQFLKFFRPTCLF